ncbi:MAG: hypothetical protein ACOC44_20100 [Promethearchaeia archaeon]
MKSYLKSIFIFYVILLYSVSSNPTPINSINRKSDSFDGGSKRDPPDTSLRKEWEEKIGGSNGKGTALSTDEQGNLYMLGNVDQEIILRKYTPRGEELWKKKWKHNYSNYGYGLKLDSEYNLWVCGYTISQENCSKDILILKYNNSGELLWNKTWGSDLMDIGYDITVNGDGNTYVCGYSEAYDINGDIIVMNLSSSGEINSVISWGDEFANLAYSIAVDHSQNIVVTGYTFNNDTIGKDLVVVKFDHGGSVLWNQTWGTAGEDVGRDLMIDENNTVYIAGHSQSYVNGENDALIMCINKSGNILWNETWGSTYDDFSYAITPTIGSEMMVAGTTKNSGDATGDFLLICYNYQGDALYNKTWDDGSAEVFYDIRYNASKMLFMIGTQNSEIYLAKYSFAPGHFSLSSDAGNPDIDGEFTLSWTTPMQANNYSLYESTSSFTEITEEVSLIQDNLTSNSYSLTKKKTGNYFFMVMAFNGFGNTSSNCLKVNVHFPPGPFRLDTNISDFTTTGNVRLNWSNSSEADNYSLYRSESFIDSLDDSCQMVANGAFFTNYTFINLTTGVYYFMVKASNIAGETYTNCTSVEVRRVPGPFWLEREISIEAPTKITLKWNHSQFSQSYSIYFSNEYISEINKSVSLLEENLTPEIILEQYQYELMDWEPGEYYFQILAFNEYFNASSNCVKVEIKDSADNEEGGDSSNEIGKDDPFNFDLPFYFLIFTGLFGLLIYVKRKKNY